MSNELDQVYFTNHVHRVLRPSDDLLGGAEAHGLSLASNDQIGTEDASLKIFKLDSSGNLSTSNYFKISGKDGASYSEVFVDGALTVSSGSSLTVNTLSGITVNAVESYDASIGISRKAIHKKGLLYFSPAGSVDFNNVEYRLGLFDGSSDLFLKQYNGSTDSTILSFNYSSGIKAHQDATFLEDVYISGNLIVSGSLTAEGFTGGSSQSNGVFTGSVFIAQDLTVTGSSTFLAGISSSGDVSLEQDLSVSGNTLISGNLTVSGSSDLSSLSISGVEVLDSLRSLKNVQAEKINFFSASGSSYFGALRTSPSTTGGWKKILTFTAYQGPNTSVNFRGRIVRANSSLEVPQFEENFVGYIQFYDELESSVDFGELRLPHGLPEGLIRLVKVLPSLWELQIGDYDLDKDLLWEISTTSVTGNVDFTHYKSGDTASSPEDVVVATNDSPANLGSVSASDIHVGESTENLVLYSQDFDNAVWDDTGLVTLLMNSLSPLGDSSAYKLQSASNTAKLSQSVDLVDGNEYTFSIWLRADSVGLPIDISISDSDGSTSHSLILKDIWQRFEVTRTVGASSHQVIVGSNNTLPTSTVIYIWGAQLEQSYSATEYVRTFLNTENVGSTLTVNQYRKVGIRVDNPQSDLHVGGNILSDGIRSYISAGASGTTQNYYAPVVSVDLDERDQFVTLTLLISQDGNSSNSALVHLRVKQVDDLVTTLLDPPETVTLSQEGIASWSAVSGATLYEYQLTQETAPFEWEETSSTSVLVDLDPYIGELIFFYVRVKGSSNDYNSTSITVELPPPATITLNSSGTASWSEIAGASGYEYQYTTSSSPSSGSWVSTPSFASYQDISMYAGQRVYLFVRAQGSTRYGSDFVDLELAAPASASLSVDGDASWASVAGASTYQYQITTASSPGPSWTTTSSTSASMDVTALAGQIIHLYVRATGSTNYASAQNTAAGVPTGLSLNASTGAISWNSVAGAFGYQYQVSASSSPSPVAWNSSPTTSLTVDVSGFAYGITIYLFVKVMGSNNYASTSDDRPLAGPSNLTINAPDNIITWSAISGVSTYEYQVSTMSSIMPGSIWSTTSNTYISFDFTSYIGQRVYAFVRAQGSENLYSTTSATVGRPSSDIEISGFDPSSVYPIEFTEKDIYQEFVQVLTWPFILSDIEYPSDIIQSDTYPIKADSITLLDIDQSDVYVSGGGGGHGGGGPMMP